MSKLIRVSNAAYSKLEKIAEDTGFSRQDVVDQALQNLERDAIFKQAHEAYAALRANPQLLREEQEELTLWETTLADGLEDE